jgi:hypothetical protein
MKTKLGLKKLSFVIVLLMSTFIFSCNDVGIMDVSESDIALKSTQIEKVADVICELTAGQTINAGNVIYEKVGESLVVTYVAANGWTLSEIHLYVGPLADLPMNKKAIQIGHFPYSAENLDGAAEWSIKIPLSNGDDCIIAAHAVVYNAEMGKEETAWANCTYNPAVAVKTRFVPDVEGELIKYAMTDGVSYIDEFKGGVKTTHWCDYLGYNIYGDGDEYLLQSKHYADAGKVVVSDDGENLIVEVFADYEMIGSYLFIGTLEELEAISLGSDNCPNYGWFPFMDFTKSDTHIYEIPFAAVGMVNNFSFESLGSNRWGWYSKCNF